MKIRKIVFTRETVFGESDRIAARPVSHAVAIAVVENPCAGRVDRHAFREQGQHLVVR